MPGSATVARHKATRGKQTRQTPLQTPLGAYRAKRNFRETPEPPAKRQTARAHQPIFVVQKHDARRLHWDFRLEHDGVLWSWAVPKGPSLDPADKRLAVHVEDHPLDYANFEGRIPEGHYGAGTVEIWDRGTWEPVSDPKAALSKGELKFILHGQRLSGHFVLVRLKPRPKERNENWLLIKEHDTAERPGADATALEAAPLQPARPAPARRSKASTEPPVRGARKSPLPREQAPQLARVAAEPPEGDEWLSEVKFDGYRLLIWKDGENVRLVTRNGLDWTKRLPTLARAVAALPAGTALLDGELVALRSNGQSSFADLQQALSDGADRRLNLFLFDLLYLDGWDLRPCRLEDRKAMLARLSDWNGLLRYSDHVVGETTKVRREACTLKLEGILCKRRDAPYRPGRGPAWVKVKCQGRDEFVVLGWTPPAGHRTGIGSLHLGFYDAKGSLHYVGGVGTGFSETELASLRRRLGKLATDDPPRFLYAGDPPARDVAWVRPELVVEVEYLGWSGSGRLRHAVFLGVREDKTAEEVVRDVPDETAPRVSQAARKTSARQKVIVEARAPTKGGAVRLSHPDRELWPGISKQDLAEYWRAVADAALPGIARRPLAVVRCPDGIDGERFFQKHGHNALPKQVREGEAGGAPYLAIDDADGLLAMAQMSAIELHCWGSSEDDPLHPDRIVFDLDPDEAIPFPDVVQAAKDVRDKLQQLGLATFCRTTGGKGLHVVAPLVPDADWDMVRGFCKGFAETMVQAEPDRFVSTVSKKLRRGRILIDWLRNGLGATAVVSFSPRARPGATVATPLAWREVTARLDPSTFTIQTIPQRLARQRSDPWADFATTRQKLPQELVAAARKQGRRKS